MARFSSIATRDSGSDQGGDATTVRRFHIGRLHFDFIAAERPLTRNCERIADIAEANYILAFPLNGRAMFSQDGRIGVVGPDEYVLLSELAFYELSAEAQTNLLLLRIPVTELRSRLLSIDDHLSRRFQANEQMTRLLVCLVRNLAELFADASPPTPQALATEVIGLTALTIGAEDRGAATDVRNARYHLRRRIVEFIESHLGDQNLSPKKIAASSRISLSYLYSLFNDNDTTVGQFVQAKRLQRAYEILVADPNGRRTVSEVAYEVGFKNVSHFSRSFSRHFRIAPRDARQAVIREPHPALMTVHLKSSVNDSSHGSASDYFDPPYRTSHKHRIVHERA